MKYDRKLASGDSVDVYQNGSNVVKIFKENMPKTAALYEALTHSRVETTGLPMPIIHDISLIDGKWAITMDCIEGMTLHELMKSDTSNIDKYINDMVDIQLLIYSKSVPNLANLKDSLAESINSIDSIDDVKKYELLTRLESMPKHRKLCHGNFTPMNIIKKDNRYYILDWVAAKQGNASADVGRTYLKLCLDFPEVSELYLDTFCKKSGTAKKYVQDWLPIIAASQLSQKIPQEAGLLYKWIDVVDYE